MKQVEYDTKEQKLGKVQYNIEDICSQLIMSPFSDKIEMVIPLRKFITPRCMSYRETKYPMAHALDLDMTCI